MNERPQQAPYLAVRRMISRSAGRTSSFRPAQQSSGGYTMGMGMVMGMAMMIVIVIAMVMVMVMAISSTTGDGQDCK